MIRRLRSLSLASLALLAASVAGARTFTNADFSGGYAFSVSDVQGTVGQWSWPAHVVGVVIADGAGGVTATRTAHWYENDNHPTNTVIHRVLQQGVGTYAISPDGTGTMSITWTPELGDEPFDFGGQGPPECRRLHFTPEETFDLALADTGFEFIVTCTRTFIADCPPPDDVFNGTWIGRTRVLPGHALRQDGPCVEASDGPPFGRATRTRPHR